LACRTSNGEVNTKKNKAGTRLIPAQAGPAAWRFAYRRRAAGAGPATKQVDMMSEQSYQFDANTLSLVCE